ncbi:hypothetical protein V6N13_109866 [Hibiscus sabdariffa]
MDASRSNGPNGMDASGGDGPEGANFGWDDVFNEEAGDEANGDEVDGNEADGNEANTVDSADENEGLLEEVPLCFPKIEHIFCARHMYANWRKVHKEGRPSQVLILRPHTRSFSKTTSQPTSITVMPYLLVPLSASSQPDTTDIVLPEARVPKLTIKKPLPNNWVVHVV